MLGIGRFATESQASRMSPLLSHPDYMEDMCQIAKLCVRSELCVQWKHSED